MRPEVTGGFGLYVHWPFCKSKCPYCDFNSHVRERIDQTRWAQAIIGEMERIASDLETRPAIETIFFGGGTPSLMAPATVETVLRAAASLFPLAEDLEVTLEANPTSSEAESFAGFRAAGVNRLSIGVQSLDDSALKFLGRQHSAAEARQTIELARSTFPRLSFDLIYARPGQSAEAWEAELAQALDLAADHLSLYQLTIEPGTKFGTLAEAGILRPLPDEPAAELYDVTRSVTESAGLPAYEISNHARAGAQSRHNLIYWRSGAWLGVGPGAQGRLPTQNGGRIATETEKMPEKWLALVEEQGHGLTLREPLAPREQAKEVLLMGLRLDEGIELARVRALASDLLDEEAIAALEGDGFLHQDSKFLRATPKGRPLLNRLLVEIIRD